MSNDPAVFYKHCKKCDTWKLSDQFHKTVKSKDGRYRHCLLCTRTRAKGYYSRSEDTRKYYAMKAKQRRNDPEILAKIAQYGRSYYTSVKGRARNLYSAANSSRVSDTHACTVTFEHILTMLEFGFCAVTGLPFDLKQPIKGKRNPFAPSIDRIDSGKGYTNENTRLVIWQYNAFKGELSDEETFAICRLIARKYP